MYGSCQETEWPLHLTLPRVLESLAMYSAQVGNEALEANPEEGQLPEQGRPALHPTGVQTCRWKGDRECWQYTGRRARLNFVRDSRGHENSIGQSAKSVQQLKRIEVLDGRGIADEVRQDAFLSKDLLP
jgi:hypothetical protein